MLFMDVFVTGIYNFQVRHPRYVIYGCIRDWYL